MRILVTGSTGLLGPYLVRAAAAIGEPVGLARRGGDINCDLGDAAAVAAAIRKVRPDLVVHAAALTSVDRCEREPDAADRANRLATLNLAEALPEEIALVYVSTDQVYPDVPGEKREEEERPVNVYGASKLAGERIVVARSNGLALRCNLFGPSLSAGRQSLSDWIIASARGGHPMTLFKDVFFSPLHMATLSRLAFAAATAGLAGVYNLGCRAGASKSEFARMVAIRLGLSLATAVEGVSTNLPGRAARPRDLRMDVTRLETALGCTLPTLAEEVAKL